MSEVTEQTTVDTSTITSTASVLAEIWRDLLGVSEVGMSDDFFKAGGTSLTAIKLLQRVEKTFGPDALSPDTLYDDPRLGSVAAAIDRAAGSR
ncbi:MAG TPA: phosphopantetheine-binding protein [Amycolatopsis sp.]|uniref:phosphopantetheine-binding protein n=1 Tax=Amycolatopsis sp. TaxID=37632 RepID=UPI002B479A45|nr:phosphopantetheine-binding protein [Amycolatopsis sp.]HKS47442.1 phosphopantetheine-binding protein [Amycolatopsis sp.]